MIALLLVYLRWRANKLARNVEKSNSPELKKGFQWCCCNFVEDAHTESKLPGVGETEAYPLAGTKKADTYEETYKEI